MPQAVGVDVVHVNQNGRILDGTPYPESVPAYVGAGASIPEAAPEAIRLNCALPAYLLCCRGFGYHLGKMPRGHQRDAGSLGIPR